MLELLITGIIALTVLICLHLTLRFFANQKSLDRVSEAHVATFNATAEDVKLRVDALNKLLLEEVAEVNRHLNAMSEDFGNRLEGLQPAELTNLNTRLAAVEAQVSTHELSLTLKRKSNV